MVLWYSALNVTVVYVTVYLEGRERASFQEVVRLQRQRRRDALVAERARIAREIHDGVGAALSGVILQAEYLASSDLDDEARAEVSELREAACEGMEELRRAVSMMRQDFQLTQAVSEYVAAFGQRHPLEATATIQGIEPMDLDPERQLVLFRAAQEALANVARHAACQQVEVELTFDDERARLEVKDDGRGFDPEAVPAGHYGLRNIHERVGKVGGEASIASEAGQGTTVVVEVPLSSPEVPAQSQELDTDG